MTALSFFGCFFTAFGPALVLFLGYVSRNSQSVILCLGSAVFWLMSILFSGIIWVAVSPLKQDHPFTICISSLIQEGFRFGLYKCLVRVEAGIFSISGQNLTPLQKLKFSFVSGLGFGLSSGSISFVSFLALSSGPAIMPSASCPGADMFFITALTTMLFIFLHTAWQMIAFHGYEKRIWWKPIFVFLTHLGASFLTILQTTSTVSNGCVVSIMLLLALLLVSANVACFPLKLHLKTQ